MATKKSISYAAPFNSKTFNRAQNTLIGLNGVVSGGKVTTEGSQVLIQPLIFVQNGLFVTTDYVMAATLPINAPPTFSIAVTTPTSVENQAEQLVPFFVLRTQDISSDTVVIADWDGDEWIERPKLQIAELVSADRERSVARDLIGVCSGFDVAVSPSGTATTATVDAGTLIDRFGNVVKKTQPTILETANSNPHYDRIDTVVYRRPQDPRYRPGEVKVLLGNTYLPEASPEFVVSGDVGIPDAITKVLRIARAGADTVFVLYLSDYGSRAELRLRLKYDDGNTADRQIVTGCIAADARYDAESGVVHIAYSTGSSVFYSKILTASELPTSAPLTIATGLNPATAVELQVVGTGPSKFIHVVFESVVSPTDSRIKYARISGAGTLETSTPATLVSLAAPISNISTAQDSQDYLLFLAYENTATGRIYLRTYDLGAVGSSSAPTQVGSTLELQDDVYNLSSGEIVTGGAATKPLVVRSSTKETFVFWLQSGNICIYSPAYTILLMHNRVTFF